MKLRVEVSSERDRGAAARLTDNGSTLATDDAVASASLVIAKKLGNPDCDPLRVGGHPPFGSYRLLHTQALDDEHREEYGAHALLFEPVSGRALEAESFGRLGLLVYGGRTGRDGRLRRTQGGVRLTDVMLDRLVTMLKPDRELTLELVPIKPPAWWAFWRPPVRTEPLSDEPPTRSSPPLDEITLLDAMLAAAPRRPRRSSDDADTRDDDRGSRDRDGSSSTTDTFKGGGGQFGGAGATGRWDAAGGVDHAGRIVAAGAVGVAIAGVAAAAASEGDSHTDTTAGTAY